MAFPDGWNRRCRVRFDSDLVASDQTDIPVVIAIYGTSSSTWNVDPEIVDTTDGNQCNSDGSDIRVTTDEAGTTQLPVDVVTVVQGAAVANCKLEFWTKLPSLSSVSDTSIYVWYKNSSATMPAVTDTYGRNAVWSDYICCFHMIENSTTLVDSTGSGYSGTMNGSNLPNRADNGTTLYGYSTEFIAADSNYLEVADTPSVDRFDIAGDYHMEALFYKTAWNNDNEFLCGRGQGHCRIRRDGANDAIGFSRVSGGNTYTGDYSAASVANSTWHKADYDFKRSTGVAGLKIEGAASSTDTHTSDTDFTGNKMRVGLNQDLTARKWNGFVKEFRVASRTFNSDWSSVTGYLYCFSGTIGIYSAATTPVIAASLHKVFEDGFQTGFQYGTE